MSRPRDGHLSLLGQGVEEFSADHGSLHRAKIYSDMEVVQ